MYYILITGLRSVSLSLVPETERQSIFRSARVLLSRRLPWPIASFRMSHQRSGYCEGDPEMCKAGDTLSPRHVSSCDINACSWDVRGDLTLNCMALIHTSVTLIMSRDLAWSSGRLTCQHASQISAVAHTFRET